MLLVALNFSNASRGARLPDGVPDGDLLFSNDPDRRQGARDGQIQLAAAEGVVLRIGS